MLPCRQLQLRCILMLVFIMLQILLPIQASLYERSEVRQSQGIGPKRRSDIITESGMYSDTLEASSAGSVARNFSAFITSSRTDNTLITGLPFVTAMLQIPIVTRCPPVNTSVLHLLSAISPTTAPTKRIQYTSALRIAGLNESYVNTTAAQNIGAVKTAQIVLDGNGCQTIYTPKVTTMCNTIIKLAGLPRVTITDCSQRVTFSIWQNTMKPCLASSNALVLPSTTTVLSIYSENVSSPAVETQRIPAQSMDATFRNEVIEDINYVADWYDLVNNTVPANVAVEHCVYDKWETACTAHMESWAVDVITTTTTATTIASFNGPAILLLGNQTLTTSISHDSTSTATGLSSYTTIVRSTIADSTGTPLDDTIATPPLSLPTSVESAVSTLASDSTGADSIVTIRVTNPTTQTYRLRGLTTTLTSRVTVTTVIYGFTSVLTINVGT